MTNSVKIPVVVVSIILLFAGSYFLYNYTSDSDLPVVDVDQSEPAPAKQEAEQAKDQQNDEAENQQSPEVKQPNEEIDESAEPNNDDLPKPVITRVRANEDDTYTVYSWVDYPENGKCIVEVSNGTTTLSDEGPTTFQPSYKQCPNITFDGSKMAKGTWQAKVRFEYNGSLSDYSEVLEFEVN